MAQVNIDTGVGSGGTYASELVIPAPALTLNAGPAATQVANVTLGAAFGVDKPAYVRFDLSTGVFAANPVLAGVASSLISQGGAGQSFVIFEVSPVAGQSLQIGTALTLTGAGVAVTSQNPVGLQYRLYEQLTSAVNQTPGTALKTASATYLSFANAIAVATNPVPNAIADVAAANGPYTAFVPAFPTPPNTRQVSNFHVTYTQYALANGNPTALTDLLANTNSVRIDGDWSVAVNAHIHDNAACLGAPAVVGTINAPRTAATFGPLSAAAITATHWYVCFDVGVPNTLAIPASDYTGLVDLVPAGPGVNVADAATAPGKIVRNGTVLKAAFAEAPADGFSGTINLSNNSTLVANFTTSCLTPTGRVAGRPGAVQPNTAARFGITASLGCPANVRGIEMTFNVPNGSVIGSVVRQNVSTGQASFDSMTGNQ